MTKLAFIADCHVANHKRWGGPVEGGLNLRGRECVETLRRASHMAAANGCVALFVLGDLFDSTRPSPSLVSATIGALVSGGLPVHVLLGNHDRQSMHGEDHACASMDWVEGLTVYAKPQVLRYQGVEVALVPYQMGEAKDWLALGLAELAPVWSGAVRTRVVLTHCGIWDDDTPAYLKAAKDAVGVGHVRWLCDVHGVQAFVAGNWHDHRSWRCREGSNDPLVLIPGTACPHSYSDPPVPGQIVFYDSGNNSTWKRSSLSSPLFVKAVGLADFAVIFSHRELVNHFASREGSQRAYVWAVVQQDELVEALDIRSNIIGAYGDRVVVHVEALVAEVEATVREAARAAVRAGSDEATLLDYADLAAVEEPGTKEGVALRLAEYRKAVG